MGESYELLKQMQWFLQPISDLILYLFTTTSGYIILLSILLLYLALSIGNSLRKRRLAIQAATGDRHARAPFVDGLYIIGDEITKTFFKIISNVPVLLGIVLFLALIVGLSASLNTFDTFLSNQQRIKELQLVLKHLDQRYKVASLEILDLNPKNNTTTLEVSYYGNNNDKVEKTEEITIKGRDIYFLSMILNFDYTEISSGKRKNIVLPYCIFSEELAKDDGIRLKLWDDNGIPFIHKRGDRELYGIDSSSFAVRMQEIAEYIHDKDKAREAGVRSFYAAAPHYVKSLRIGQKITIWVEQTGGMVIKEEKEF